MGGASIHSSESNLCYINVNGSRTATKKEKVTGNEGVIGNE